MMVLWRTSYKFILHYIPFHQLYMHIGSFAHVN